MATRMSGPGKAYEGFADGSPRHPQTGEVQTGRRGHWTGRVALIPDQLEKPLHWRKPRRIATCLMGDLFHESLSDKDIARVFAVMRSEAKHTFQVLTKRPRRMRKWFSRCGNGGGLGWITHNNTEPTRSYRGTGIIVGNDDRWPLPNVWLGVSVEDQATADERIPLLLQTPAAVRWVSYEPALAGVDFGRVLGPFCGCPQGDEPSPCDEWQEGRPCPLAPSTINWLVIGGESGPGARPCDVEWIRGAVRQCQDASVPAFVKQRGRLWYDSRRREGVRGSCAVPVDAPWSWVKQRHPKGGDPAEWPEGLRVREFPA